MQPAIAIVGMACRYPDARSPMELWENVLAQRQAFRQFPPERLRIQDYIDPDRTNPDTTYSTRGAFLENYEFDRVRFHISGATYRVSDLAHWLALDIASQALQDAGFQACDNIPNATTGVIVGNTLTGEFSRANSLRLRWPYVRRVVEDNLLREGWPFEQRHLFLNKLEQAYKEPFAPVSEETLAGGLSNTIAGRICNYFNLKGGGYTVDGACASSLLAVITACTALLHGDLDLALAGGVDLSLDPFEMIGFARTAALSRGDMRVYDVHSDGFLPGEGCGFVTLMRYEDAVAQQKRIYALIRGWGVSSDGSGGITRPEVEGQSLALTRAYNKAGIGIDSIAYFEGHGTGTQVGDTTELQTLSKARRQANATASTAVIGSVKANIGHTKAAAGIAGLIKATMAVYTQVLPPMTGTVNPHAELQARHAPLRLLDAGVVWPAHAPLYASVNAMGFGGINTHVVLDGCSQYRRTSLTAQERILVSSPQDAEMLLLRESSVEDALNFIDHILAFSARLSNAEITDLAVCMAKNLHSGDIRAALVVKDADELTHHLERLKDLLVNGHTNHIDTQKGIFLGCGREMPRIGFLFTGQAAPIYKAGGLLRRRFADIDQLYSEISFPEGGDEQEKQDTAVAQPAIIAASLAALSILNGLGIVASAAVGHSLGELAALHWAGAFDRQTLLRLASLRGQIMSQAGSSTGRMATVMASYHEVEELIEHEQVVISALNAPRQTVVSGEASAIATIIARAKARKVPAIMLPVTQAFHSPLVARSVQPFAHQLAQEQFAPLKFPVYSTVTGDILDAHTDLKELLCQQITAPVQFMPALSKAASHIDLWFEVGPGNIMQSIASRSISQPVIALDAGSRSIKGVLAAAGAAFTQGAALNIDFLFADRFYRPFDLNWQTRFLANPCEQAPLPEEGQEPVAQREIEEPALSPLPLNNTRSVNGEQKMTSSALNLIKQIVARRIELPEETIDTESRMLSDLHLNSLTVGQIVSEVARALHLLPPTEPTSYANATIADIAHEMEALQQRSDPEQTEEQTKFPAGVDSWVRPFTIAYVKETRQPVYREEGVGHWELLTPCESSLAALLHDALPRLAGRGVVVYLPRQTTEQHLGLVLEGAHRILKQHEYTHFVLLQHGGEGSGLARTLFLETQQKTVCVINLPCNEHPEMIEWVIAEIRAARGYSETCYDAEGVRYVPRLQHMRLSPATLVPLQCREDDVLLVTGGGKGIAAECAIFLACKLGIKLAILGRSKPEHDQVLSENLQRMQAAGICYRYYSSDVTQAEAVQQAISRIEADLGTVTAVLHGAGMNVPKLLSTLEEGDITQTFAPKVHGLQHVLAALNPEKLKLLVTFGSIIACTGMQGEADYALANDWLARLTEAFHREHPACRCFCLEWSVWSSIGMGEYLGRVEALIREGILPIPPEEGINQLYCLLNHQLPEVRFIVSSRLGDSATLNRDQPQLPFLRFLEQPKIFYPGIELVSEAEISLNTDLFIEDHAFKGERLLPAVTGLEAMAQAAMAVSMNSSVPVIEDIHFYKPVIVPQKGTTTLRIAALVRESGKVDVVLRSEETAFQVDHFRATCCFTSPAKERLASLQTMDDFPSGDVPAPIDLEPQQDLYGPILFHKGCFRRIRSYRHLRAKECIAEIAPPSQLHLYAYHLPAQMFLGDFIARDAVIHAIQACIPSGTLLPIEVERITFTSDIAQATYPRFVYARERDRINDTFIYDVEVRTAQKGIIEQWQGLRLQRIESIKPPESWKYTLLAPFVERRIDEMLPGGTIRLTLQHHDYGERSERSEQTLYSVLGNDTRIHHLPDGKPVVIDKVERSISTAHSGKLTLGVVSNLPVGCDIEGVISSSSSWLDLLGPSRYQLATLIARECHEEIDCAATRIWTALESLKKAGAQIAAPLLFSTADEEGWVQFNSGRFRIITYIAQVQGMENPLSLAVCIRRKTLANEECTS
jgi:enediyne polyketide synthase